MSCICEYISPTMSDTIVLGTDAELMPDASISCEQSADENCMLEPAADAPDKHSLVNASTLVSLQAEVKELRKTLTDTQLSIQNQECAIKAAINKQYALQQELDDVRAQHDALQQEYDMQLNYTQAEREKLDFELLASQQLFESREQLTAEMEQRNAQLLKELVEANDKMEQLALKYCGLKVHAVDLHEQMDDIEHVQLEDDIAESDEH